MKGFTKIISLVAASTLLFSGCGNISAKADKPQTKDKDGIEIGLCFDSFVIERWEKDRDVFVDTASGLGATVNVQNANGDVDKQIEQIEYLVDKGVDCLVIIPVDGSVLGDAVALADTDLYISFDNNMVGQMLGEALVDAGATKVVKICGPHTDNNVSLVSDGFDSVIKEHNVEIIDSYYCDGWKAELGGAYVYDNMDTIRQADAIMCGNDDVATSVIRALAVSQLAGVVPVVGQDADLPACQHIVEGTQLMTVYKPVGELAKQAAELSYKLATGDSLSVDTTINDGSFDVPYVTIDPVAVNKENIDDVIIAGGFHSHEDVYMNVE